MKDTEDAPDLHYQAFNGVDVISATIDGRQVLFAVDMENDPIQRNHRRGQFYEGKELRAIRQNFPKGGVFIDIGANVGNHSLFVAHFLRPAAIIPFEPNPRAYRLLEANVHLNGFQDVFDLRHLGFGVGAEEVDGFAMEDRQRNLGGAKMIPGAGDITVKAADDMLAGVAPSFIKIDVEGMELSVLKGLEGIVANHKPVLLVEVDDSNADKFHGWVEAQDYGVMKQFRRYKTNENFLIQHKSRFGGGI